MQSGARVIALGRRLAPLEALAAEFGPAIAPRPCDVTDPGALARALGDVDRLDAIVVNAGRCEAAQMDDAEAEAVWRRVMAVNLDGAFNTLRVAGPKLRAGGRVVLVSSGLGRRGRAGYAAYTAAKHGVIGLARALALEWAPRRVTVNAICPGWVDTAMARGDLGKAAERAGIPPSDARSAAEAAIPLGRFVDADEVAALVSWLCAPSAGMITGQAYGISGGEVIG